MKSEDIQKLVLSKYQKGESPTKIFEDLNGFVSIWTVRRWCKMVNETGSINLSYSTGRPRIIRTKGMIQKVKNRMNRKKQVLMLLRIQIWNILFFFKWIIYGLFCNITKE